MTLITVMGEISPTLDLIRRRFSYSTSILMAMLMVASFASGAHARESSRAAEGGGFDAFTSLLGPAGWIASGMTVARNDISRMHGGPSGIRSNTGDAIWTTYSQPFGNIDGFDLGGVEVTSDRLSFGNVGFSFSQLQIAGIREASNGALTGNFFDAHMNAARLSFAPRHAWALFNGRIGYGAQVNYYDISIRERSKARVAFDFGADFSFDSVRITMNLRNLSTNRSNNDNADGLPLKGELRGEWTPYSLLHLGGTFSMRENGEGQYQLGAQYDVFKLISVMGGYMSPTRQWTAGAALHYGDISLEYGLAAHRELDFSHTVSLGVEFASGRLPEAPEASNTKVEPVTDGNTAANSAGTNSGRTSGSGPHLIAANRVFKAPRGESTGR